MKVSDYHFNLPNELIASIPTDRRDESRLMVLDKTGDISHRKFSNIVSLLSDQDVLVFNNTKVFPARLIGKNKETGGKIEILLNHQVGGKYWEVIGKNLAVGKNIIFDNSHLEGEVISKEDKTFVVNFNLKEESFFIELEKIGLIPLPPYIESKRKINHTLYDKDKERYQTIYAKERGSVAAPTAGLHFSQDLLKKIKDKGVKTFELTLHVGLGTFAHVETAEVEDHKIHQEFYSISRESYDSLSELKKSGHRIVSVGTTTTRVLETIFSNPLLVDDEQSTTLSGWTDIYIYPGYKFKFVDSLITNFHLPSSSLLFLVAALVGKENILNAYEEAIKEKYRFYSYGDAMFID